MDGGAVMQDRMDDVLARAKAMAEAKMREHEACRERDNEMMSRVAYDLVSVGNRHQRRVHAAKFRKANK